MHTNQFINTLIKNEMAKKTEKSYYTAFITGRLTLSPDEIKYCVGKVSGISVEEMEVPDRSPGARKRENVVARQSGMHIIKNYTRYSLADNGKQFGGRDHATVLHACKTVSNLLDVDRDFQEYYWAVLNEVFRLDQIKRHEMSTRYQHQKAYIKNKVLIISTNPTFL